MEKKNTSDQFDNTGNINWTPFIITVIVVFILWISSYFLIVNIVGCDQAGATGDTFGAINALFSGLAFAGVIYAILLQREELKAQREELKLNRRELELSRGEFEQQNTTLKRQAFENTFFNLLSQHNQIVNSLDVQKMANGQKGDVIASARDCFRSFYTTMERFRDKRAANTKEDYKLFSPTDYVDLYLKLYDNVEGDLGHYFRGLYNIVKYVDKSELSETEKKTYVNIVRAQISNYELILLFYNCLSKFGKEKFRPLIIKYALLKNINIKRLFNEEHKRLYPNAAYGAKDNEVPEAWIRD